MEKTIRIHVGGLGETVTDEDIRNTFSKLGTVEAVDIVRTKGRSFAYVNFLPSSDKSLAKLFSTYNGCSWKGGKLRLEKARQHYLDKLKAEWAEEFELAKKKQEDDTLKAEKEEKKNAVSQVGRKRAMDEKDVQIQMFIPRLRKIKSLPYRGTGKHKYSFQRVEAPPLPHHFCDCMEHSRDLECEPRQLNQNVVEKGGMNEYEINIMNSVMNKLLKREKNSKTKAGTEVSEHHLPKENGKDNTTDDDDDNFIVINTRHRQDDESLLLESLKWHQRVPSQVDGKASGHPPRNHAGKDDATDDDNMVINMGSSYDDERILLESMKQQRTRPTKKVKRLVRSQDSEQSEPGVDKDKPSRKKTKLTKFGGSEGVSVASAPDGGNKMQNQLNKAEKKPESSAPREDSTTFNSSAGKKKLNWKSLIAQKDNSPFTLSSLIPGGQSSKDLEHPEPEAFLVPSDDDAQDPKLGDDSVTNNGSSCHMSSKSQQHGDRVSTEEPNDSHDIKLGDDVTNTVSLNGGSSESRQSDSGVSSEKLDDSDHPKLGDHDALIAISDPGSSEPKQSGCDVSSVKPDDCQDPKSDYNVTNNESSDPVSSDSKQCGGVVSSEKPTRGASWYQKSSWTQLVGGGSSNGAFSLSQILTGTNSQKKNSRTPFSQPSSAPDDPSKLPGLTKLPSNSALDSGKQLDMSVPQKDKDTGISSNRKENEGRGWWKNAQESNLVSASSMKTDKVDPSLPEKRVNPIVKRSDNGSKPTVTISETCPFMRSASSLKEWKTTKEALSRSLRKRKKEEK